MENQWTRIENLRHSAAMRRCFTRGVAIYKLFHSILVNRQQQGKNRILQCYWNFIIDYDLIHQAFSMRIFVG